MAQQAKCLPCKNEDPSHQVNTNWCGGSPVILVCEKWNKGSLSKYIARQPEFASSGFK